MTTYRVSTPQYHTWQPSDLKNEAARLNRLATALDAERRLRVHGGQASDRPYHYYSAGELHTEARRLARDRAALTAALRAGGRA
ncbi:MAG: hypothetical protein NHG36_06480 [Chromatiaceae bacterium]|nr:hypothetical protein [Candidatus Thioaporhodococcus sediminis]